MPTHQVVHHLCLCTRPPTHHRTHRYAHRYALSVRCVTVGVTLTPPSSGERAKWGLTRRFASFLGSFLGSSLGFFLFFLGLGLAGCGEAHAVMGNETPGQRIVNTALHTQAPAGEGSGGGGVRTASPSPSSSSSSSLSPSCDPVNPACPLFCT